MVSFLPVGGGGIICMKVKLKVSKYLSPSNTRIHFSGLE